MNTTILNYGLYGDTDKNLLPDFVHCEPLDTRSRKYNWAIKQHLHAGLFQIFYYAEGSGEVLNENKSFTVKAPSLLIIPENTLHGFRQQPNVKGTVITLSSAYLEQLFPINSSIVSVFTSVSLFTGTGNHELFERTLSIIDTIRVELFNSFAHREIMLQSLFMTLFTCLFRLADIQYKQPLPADNRSVSIFKSFLRNVRKNTSPHKPIQTYASELSITAVHLNRVCRQVCQKSATEVVKGHYISAAKKYFALTSLSIAEVAYQLNFEDPAYFSRYFRKNEGMSPKAYVKAINPPGNITMLLEAI